MFESNTEYCLSRVHGCWVRPFARMKYAAVGFALSVLAALTLHSAPTVAQEQTRTQSVEIFGGEQFGDNLTDGPVSGRTPRLNDGAVAGARYNYPQYPVVAYVLIGAGYAWANLDTPFAGEINGRAVTLTDSNGFTANAGIGAKYYVNKNLYVDVLARYRYLNGLVSDSNQHLNTTETTLGIGWRF